MYKRQIDLLSLLKRKSFFLFGPRQTGKSTLIRTQFPKAAYYDLLEADTFRELSARPEYIRQTLPPAQSVLIIDEIQKLPSLLDEVQLLMDRNKNLRVIMTGSSARKLRRGSTNLLAGRAWTTRLHPLISSELGFERLLDRINLGGLPSILDSKYPDEDRKAYAGTYLAEEIRAEGLTRSIENFSRFLEVAALVNGEQLNFTELGNDAGVPPRTVREYFQVLEDTLIAHQLPAYRKTKKRKPVATSKFYFFDIGVVNSLRRTGRIQERSPEFGRALEHLIFLELRAYLDYSRIDEPLTYWRSLSQFEVDFLIGDKIAIEVKAKSRVSEKDCKALLALYEEIPLRRRIVVCGETRRRVDDTGNEMIPITSFLKDLWSGNILG